MCKPSSATRKHKEQYTNHKDAQRFEPSPKRPKREVPLQECSFIKTKVQKEYNRSFKASQAFQFMEAKAEQNTSGDQGRVSADNKGCSCSSPTQRTIPLRYPSVSQCIRVCPKVAQSEMHPSQREYCNSYEGAG